MSFTGTGLPNGKWTDDGRVRGRIAAAVDGIEVLSSYSRGCDACLERRVSVRQGGVKVERLQYYHRAVACQIVSSSVKAVLAVERLLKFQEQPRTCLHFPTRPR
jgi:hypothetical protein